MTIEQKQKLGAYYTPEQVTDCLSTWAIRSPSDIILEPSFGGCNFLTSSVEALKKLGAKNPYNHIFGFDIDSTAFEILQQKSLDGPNFFCEDFLKSEREQVIKANVILGNPPFLPIHKLEETYKLKLFQQFQKSNFRVPKRSSLWIYFIVHSFRYLSLGGKMAWVVPDSIAFTDYGKYFIKQLSLHFTSVKVIRIDERYFSEVGTKEKTSFLLCDGFQLGSSTPEEFQFKHLDDALVGVSGSTTSPNLLRISEDKQTDIPTKVSKKNFTLKTLGDLFDIKIGIVIGATDLLVFNQQDAEKTPFYPKYTYPVITKGKQLNGLSINREKLCLQESNLPLYLINGIKLEEENPNLYSELLSNIPEKVLLNQTFRKRTKLFGYDDYRHPDAFLTFYAQGLPKFIVNEYHELNCTNSVHRLYLKESYDPTILKFIAIQFFCGILADDMRGLARLYGNSIHKYEPSDARRIPIFIPVVINDIFREKVSEAANKIEKNFELNDTNIARKTAFEFIKNLIF